jgi:glycosyltransferase involved in cell wall biosynthesis
VIGQLTVGGAEKQLWLLCRALDRETAVPFVYCLSDHTVPYGPQLEACGARVRCISGGRLAQARMLREWLARDRIDLVHAWLFIADAYAWLATLGSGRPLLTSSRNCKRQGHLLDAVNRRAFAASAAIVVNSRDVARYIAHHYGVPKDRIRVIYNAIDTSRFHPSAKPGAETRLVVAVGRLVDQKNHSLFLRAAAELVQDVPEARFVIVGDGPLRGPLQAQANALGIGGRVSFTGERRDVDAILRTAALFWLTSRWEGMPNAVLEAMASGLPVIATDVGGTRELIRPGVDGFVVPEDDAGAFVRHSRELLEPAMRRLFAAAARARAEEFSTARMVSALSQLYDDTLGRNH